jgi:4-amino-4-deoxy-L-arabinose transferase-like glycosyltransferase
MPSLVLAPVAAATGDNELAMRLEVAFMGVGVVILGALLAWELAGPRASIIAGAIAALYPNLWAYDGLLLSETFSALATAATLIFTYRLIRRLSWRSAVGAGLGCGFAMLSRSELALFVPLIALPAALTVHGSWRRRLGMAGLIVGASAIVVAPWIGYNLSRFEKPVYLSEGGGGLLGANCSSTYYGPYIGFWNGFCTVTNRPGDPSVVDNRKANQAFRYMRAHLGRLPIVIAARVGRVWSVYRPAQLVDFAAANGVPKWVSWIGWGSYLILVVLAVAGIVVLRRRGATLFPLLAVAAIVTLVAAGVYGRPRFRVPAEISIVVLAAAACDGLVRRPAGQPAASDRRG